MKKLDVSLSTAGALLLLLLGGVVAVKVSKAAESAPELVKEWAVGMGMDRDRAEAATTAEHVRYLSMEALEKLALVVGLGLAFRGLLLRAGLAAAAAAPLGWGGAVLGVLASSGAGRVLKGILEGDADGYEGEGGVYVMPGVTVYPPGAGPSDSWNLDF